MRGNDFEKKNWCQKRKNIAHRRKMDPKIHTFGQVKSVFWSFLGRKSRFLAFFKVVLDSLFSILKCLLLGVCSVRKIDKWLQTSKLLVKNLLILAVLRGHF